MTDQPTPTPTAHEAVTTGPFRDLAVGALVADASLKVHDAIEQWHATFGTEHDDEAAFRGNIASALYQAGMLCASGEDEATVERAARAVLSWALPSTWDDLDEVARNHCRLIAKAVLRAARDTS